MEWIKRLSDYAKNFYCQLGELTGIGATAHLWRICGKTILMDFGVSISRNGDFQVQGYPAGDFLIGQHIDLIIITHAHLDHFGAIARFVRHHPEAKIVASWQALQAIEFVLADSLKIMEDERRRAALAGHELGEPLFNEHDRLNFLNNPNLVVVGLPSWLKVQEDLGDDWSGWEIGFHDSGHDVGAMMSFFIDPTGWRYFVTGDVCSHAQLKGFLAGVMLPDRKFCGDFFDYPERLTMVTEATNGAKPMTETLEEALFRLGRKLKEVDERGGQAFFCAFSKNRCSKMALACIQLGYIPFVDGSGRKMMRLELGDDYVDQLLKSGKLIFIHEGKMFEDRQKADRQRNSLLSGELGFHPGIAPAGTLEGGFSVSCVSELLPDEKNAIIFPGHMFPESTSKQIFEMEKGRTINLKIWDRAKRVAVPTPVNVRAEVCHFDFTSHDKQGGLLERIRLVQPRTLIIHHCSDESYEALSKLTNSLPNPPKHIARAGHQQVIEL